MQSYFTEDTNVKHIFHILNAKDSTSMSEDNLVKEIEKLLSLKNLKEWLQLHSYLLKINFI